MVIHSQHSLTNQNVSITHCWGTSGICKNKNNVKISIILVIFEIIQNNVNISNKEPLFDLNVGDISRYVFKAVIKRFGICWF